jgi:hypothetical protein
VNDNGPGHPHTSPMQSPGSEGPPSETEHTEGDPDIRGGNGNGGTGERGNNKGKKLPAK